MDFESTGNSTKDINRFFSVGVGDNYPGDESEGNSHKRIPDHANKEEGLGWSVNLSAGGKVGSEDGGQTVLWVLPRQKTRAPPEDMQESQSGYPEGGIKSCLPNVAQRIPEYFERRIPLAFDSEERRKL